MLIEVGMLHVVITSLEDSVCGSIPLRQQIQKELDTPETFGSVSGFSVTGRTYDFMENMVEEGMEC